MSAPKVGSGCNPSKAGPTKTLLPVFYFVVGFELVGGNVLNHKFEL